MARFCSNCGASVDENANFCPACRAQLSGAQAQKGGSDTAKTIAVAAGTAAGVSLLGSLLHRRRRYLPPPVPHGPRLGPHGFGGPRGPHGPGGRR